MISLFFLVSRYSGTGAYTIDADWTYNGAPVEEDWSSSTNRYPVQHGWGDMVADTLEAGDVDGFEVTLTRGDRFTIDVHPGILCDTKIEVVSPLLPGGLTDYFLGKPFIWDDENNSADRDEVGYGDQVSFVAERDGPYTIDISPGPAACYSEYVAYFHLGPDEMASNLAPPLDRIP